MIFRANTKCDFEPGDTYYSTRKKARDPIRVGDHLNLYIRIPTDPASWTRPLKKIGCATVNHVRNYSLILNGDDVIMEPKGELTPRQAIEVASLDCFNDTNAVRTFVVQAIGSKWDSLVGCLEPERTELRLSEIGFEVTTPAKIV